MTGLARRIGPVGAVAIGVTSMLGAGVFVAFGPAAAAAGDALFVALGMAGGIAVCNAISSSRLAIKYPTSGGTYIYAREELSPWAGLAAGWAFVLGKTASCAAMALAIGLYIAPGDARWLATAAIVVATGVNLLGVQRSVGAMVAIGSIVVGSVVVAAVVLLGSPSASTQLEGTEPLGVVEAAAILFFAFAGYARLSTLGEEVREPARTIPLAVTAAIAVVAIAYGLTAWALIRALGGKLTTAPAPLSDALTATGADMGATLISTVAVVAAGGALLSLSLGVSRTTLAMARDGHLPDALSRINRGNVPWTAELAVAAGSLVALWTLDLRSTIGFSSFCVLLYYALANASAYRLGGAGRIVAVVGFVGCLVLAVSLVAA